MAEKFPNLTKNINLHNQEAHQIPSKINSKRLTTRHIIIKLLKAKTKDRVLKVAREKWFTEYKASSIRAASDFSSEINGG